MIVALTGVILMLFVIGHLLGNLQIFLGPRWVNDYAQHLRYLTGRTFYDRFTMLKNDTLNHYVVYSMMVYGFQNVYVSAFYIIGLFLLTLHLTHGASGFFLSLGLNDTKLTPPLAFGARVF